MKHIKKRYLYESKNDIDKSFEILEKFEKPSPDLVKKSKDKDLLVTLDDGTIIKAFIFNSNNGTCMIPIPDLSLVYFDGAYNLNTLRKGQEVELFKKIKMTNDSLGETATQEIYRYYGYASSCLISLFTALESFVNHILPNDKLYHLDTNKNTEYYSKEQIQKYIQFDNKVKKVLPHFFEDKNFFKHPTTHTQHIENLKNLRNEIVHPKSERNSTNQEELIKKLLNFNFDKTFEAVAHFMNFYVPDYIVECNCGVDY